MKTNLFSKMFINSTECHLCLMPAILDAKYTLLGLNRSAVFYIRGAQSDDSGVTANLSSSQQLICD